MQRSYGKQCSFALPCVGIAGTQAVQTSADGGIAVCDSSNRRAELYVSHMRDAMTEPEPGTLAEQVRPAQWAEIPATLGLTASGVRLVFWGFGFGCEIGQLSHGVPLETWAARVWLRCSAGSESSPTWER